MFEVGQQVVCIKGDVWEDEYGYTAKQIVHPVPIKGCIYTVSYINQRYFEQFGWMTGLRLVEFPGVAKFFNANCFAPIRKTDISIFTDMLKELEVG